MSAYTFTAGDIRITIDCRVLDLGEFVGERILEAVPGLYLGVTDLTEAQSEWLSYGLTLVAEPFMEKTDRFDVVVEVVTLDDDPAHTQPEALACAIAGWMARAFRLPYTPPPVTYDETKNRYTFDFP